jgi:proline iminopeptidase
MDEGELERLFEGRTTSDDDFRTLIAMIMPLYTTTYDPARDAEQVAAMQIHHATHNYAFAHNQQGFDLRDRLGELRVPVLITVGRHDWITPLVASEELHALIPGSELVIFENSGHGPQNEEREAWRAAVRRFLDRVVPA